MTSAPEGIIFDLIFRIIYTVLFGVIGLGLGRFIVWIASLGRYPKKYPSPAQRALMFAVGALAVVVALVALRNLIWP